MPQLRNIDRYKLANLLTSFASNPVDATAICAEAIDNTDPAGQKTFNINNITINGVTPIQMWTSLITAAEDQQMLLFLIEVFKTRNPGNQILNSCYDEIKDGFGKRVSKIATAIKQNKCVLFIGPELLQCRNGANIEPFTKFLSHQLSTKLVNAGVYFDDESKDSLSYIANRYEDIPRATNRDMGTLALKSFNAASIYRNVYEQIAQLKFPLIISTNPDDILETEYTAQGIAHTSGYYDRSNQDKNTTVYDENNPIIYKIFGSFQSPFSILFTENDRVQFSKNVVKNEPPIPPIIKVLLEGKYCLFLGFNFHEWHLKILIDCLGLTKADSEERIYALLMEKANESSIEHFEKNYKFYFINNQIEEFMKKVIDEANNLP
jgi:hypothetical protein